MRLGKPTGPIRDGFQASGTVPLAVGLKLYSEGHVWVSHMNSPETLQRYSRVAGVAMLLTIVFGTIGELVLPGRIIVSNDAAATAANITGNPMLIRYAFASYLVEGICDILLCVLWYILLKPVNRNLALISAFLGIVSMVTFAVSQANFFASSLILRETGGMLAFSKEQREALAFLYIRIAGMIAWLFVCFYGMASLVRGYLIMRSGYLPKVLGILLMIGGTGFVLRGLTYILAPSLSSPVLLMPMALAGIPITIWLLARGIDTTKLRTTAG